MWTEEQIEGWLVSERRQLPLPGGSAVSVTLFRLYWETFDTLVLCNGFSSSDLASYAVWEAEREGTDVSSGLRRVIARLDRQWINKNELVLR